MIGADMGPDVSSATSLFTGRETIKVAQRLQNKKPPTCFELRPNSWTG